MRFAVKLWWGAIALWTLGACTPNVPLTQPAQDNFTYADCNRDGTLSQDEFTRAFRFKIAGSDLKQADATMFAQADTNHDNKVDFPELTAWAKAVNVTGYAFNPSCQ